MGTLKIWRALSLAAAGAFAAVALASCGQSNGLGTEAQVVQGKDQGPVLDARQGNSPRAPGQASREFQFVRYSIDVSNDLPKACLVFSSTLKQGTDFRPFVDAGKGPQIAVSADGANLCVGGLTFGEPRDIVIRSGLPSNDGRTLAFDETVGIEFGDRPAFVGFKGDGIILPRVDADGLALETVNVDKVKVTISRITDRALAFQTITQGFQHSQGDWAYMESDPTYQYAQKLWTGEIDTPGSPNVAKTTVFPIAKAVPKLQPGAYFVELSQLDAGGKVPDNSAEAKRWLIITDLAVTTYTGTEGMSATVRSLQSAKSVSGVKLELIARNNDILARGDTDAAGHVRFSGPILKGEGPMSPRALMAYAPNGDFAMLDLDRAAVDLSERDVGGRSPAQAADAFVYTERGVYRPGEVVQITSLVRDAAANSLNNRAGSVIVYGPNGLEAGRQRFKDAKEFNGGVSYAFPVPKTAARGEWRIATEIDGVGVAGGETFSVEDFVPQRIALEVTADDKTPMRAGETRPITSSVRFLYGAPGADLPIEGNVRVETDPNPFPELKGYDIGLHTEEFRESTFDLAAATTDASGKAVISLDPRAAQNAKSSRPLRLRAVISAIEPGGRAVRDDVRVAYRPEARYVGVKAAFEDRSAKEGDPANFEVVSVDRTGALKAATVNWRLVRIDWKYDWYRNDNSGGWQWRQSRRIVEIEDGTLKIAEGQRGNIKTRTLDWGDYELYLTEEGNGGEASYAFWSGWGGQPVDGVEAPDRVRVQVPDKLPAVGAEVDVTILAPYSGEAELVVASENVILTRSLTVKANEGMHVKLPVTKEWGAGVYVMASVYTPRDAVQRPKPRRAVGVEHLGVDVSSRTFKLTMAAPKVQRPNNKMTVEITAAGPRDNGYVQVAAVDEGILLLTGFKTPDPADYFFGKRRLGVELRDDYGRLLDPNQGAAGNIRQGGDQIGGAGLTVVPTMSVALVSKPVKLENGKATVTFDVPAFNGELRLMAVAWSDTGVGSASQPVTVRDQVPALMALPRFLSPGDQAVATLTLDNVEGQAGVYNAAIQSTAPVRAVNAALQATLAVGQRRDIDASFTSSTEGISNISFNVTGPANYSVRRDYPIQTRSAWMPASYVQRTTIQPGQTFSPAGNSLSSFVPGSGSVQVSFSPIPMDAAALFDSLDRYPYGCTEQIVSRAMPLLYAHQMAALAGRKTPGDLKTSIQDAVSTLLNRQAADGSIGLWRVGDGLATPWLGAYATDFLFRAKASGYVVPDAALDKAYDALESFAVREQTYSSGYDFDVWESRWNNDTKQRLLDRSTAYAAYVLAKAGRMDKSRLRYLHDDRLNRMESPLSRAQLGAALFMIGDNARSKSAFDAAEAVIGWENDGDYYQTRRRDLAGVLALAQEARQTERVTRLAQRVAQDLPEPDRLTTQEKAFLLLAANALSGGQAAVNVAVTGQADALSTGGRVFKMVDAQMRTPPTFTNRGTGQLWVTSVARGSPATAPEPAYDGLTAYKQLWTPGGQAINGASFQQGDRIIIAITVGASEARKTPLVIADLLPAGFEIEAVLRPEDGGNTGPYGKFLGEIATPNIAEARDDRFVAAVDLYDRNKVTVAYMVRAVTPGTFTMPGVVAEDMYHPETFARTVSRTITVGRRT